MRKIALLFATLILGLTVSLCAGTVAGVAFPDTVQVNGTPLTLNGAGLCTRYTFKMYVAGLYLAEKSSDPNIILKVDTPKRIVMHFVRNVGKEDITEAFSESLRNNMPNASKSVKSDIDRLFAAIEPVKEGQEMIFTYIPGTGTSFAVGGKEKLSIETPDFGRVLFAIWLGPKPPNATLKKGMLGQ